MELCVLGTQEKKNSKHIRDSAGFSQAIGSNIKLPHTDFIIQLRKPFLSAAKKIWFSIMIHPKPSITSRIYIDVCFSVCACVCFPVKI